MSRELNKIFDVKSRQARRDILDKFDLSKEDKNKVLNKIDACKNDDKIIYYEVTSAIKDFTSDERLMYFDGFKLLNGGTCHFMNSIMFNMIVQNDNINTQNYSSDDIIMIAFAPFHLNVNNRIMKYNTFEEILLEIGSNPSVYIKRRVTAEEYWNNENIKKLPTFTIAIESEYYTGTATRDMLAYHIKTYEYEPNMTMYDWINSKYNVDNIVSYSERGDGYKAPFYNNGKNPFMFVADTNNHLFLDDNKINDFANSSIAVLNISSNNKTVYVNFIAKWYV